MRHRRVRHSLSGKLVLLFLATAAVFIVFVGGSFRMVFHSNVENQFRPHLLRYLTYLQNDIGIPPDIRKAQSLARDLSVDIHVLGPEQAWSSGGVAPKREALKVYRRFTENEVEYVIGHYQGNDYLIAEANSYTLAFSVPRTRHADRWHWTFPVAVSLLVLLGLYHATRRLFRPIEQLKEGVERIGRGELDQTIKVHRRDELGDLASSINAMSDEIRQMLEAKRQLLLAISHELRSPLTRTKVALEMAEDEKVRDGMRRDLDDMERLIEELLETERLSTSHRILHRTRVDLVQLVTKLLSEYYTGDAVEALLPNKELVVEIDVPRIKLLLKNLLGNALRHTPEGAPRPQLQLESGEESYSFTVRDFGEGIDKKHLPHLSEPFYRADAARQRETGGYGLGLYLCRVIAEAHGGTIHIESQPQKGTEVRVILPSCATKEGNIDKK